MAKLNKMEISAIASKIVGDIVKARKEQNSLKQSEESFDSWKQKFITSKAYKSLLNLNEAKRIFNLEFKGKKRKYGYAIKSEIIDVDNILKQVFEQDLKLLSVDINISEIERDIIIAQAKNEDLDKLIAELTKKYSV